MCQSGVASLMHTVNMFSFSRGSSCLNEGLLFTDDSSFVAMLDVGLVPSYINKSLFAFRHDTF